MRQLIDNKSEILLCLIHEFVRLKDAIGNKNPFSLLLSRESTTD